MAAPTKQASRWGSFLQQAVAGVESRLDNILAEGAEEEAGKPASLSAKPVAPAPAPGKLESGNVSRSASTSSRTPDRLQERLAKAIAAKNLSQKEGRPDSLALSSATPSRTGSPVTAPDSPRRSLDVASQPTIEEGKPATVVTSQPAVGDGMNLGSKGVDVPSISVEAESPSVQPALEGEKEINGLSSKLDSEPGGRLSIDSIRSSLPRDSIDSVRPEPRSSAEIAPTEITSRVVSALKTPEEYEALLQQLQSDFETSELQRQEEVHVYVEKIDTMQSKLQYLARESSDAARRASGSAAAGSLEKKLADKEEQVSLLMEEGQKLSKKELAQMTTIKKLRAKIQEESKELTEAKSLQEKAEKEAANLAEKLRRAETSEKRLNERQKQITQLQRNNESLKAERDSKDSIIASLRKELEEAASQEKKAEAKLASEALEAERKRAAELEDDLANARIEKNLASDRAQAQIKTLREQIDKDAERARIQELESKTEQHMLESKLEVMRARAEEVSSGATGDAQAKLLRQIETLQTQYAVASENWQGIETSLLARATNLEKERDEATRREADVRRKAREVTVKAKRREDELEETCSKMPTFQQELNDSKDKLESLQKRAEEAEAALKEARAAFDQERQTLQAEIQQRFEEERQKWQEEVSASIPVRADSPVASSRRGLTSEYLGLQNLQLRRASAARSINSDVPTTERMLARRSSTQPFTRSSGNRTPIRQDSLLSPRENEDLHPSSEAPPSIHTDHDDFFDHSPASPHQAINELVSASASTANAGAGPSVQLVERMSSAVRRLESEKVATKEDLARLSAQRDEARAEIVALMKEVEAKRAADEKAKELEEQVKVLQGRYETTLEMLGEKSELVDELRSDIDDIKQMYRELVERTVK